MITAISDASQGGGMKPEFGDEKGFRAIKPNNGAFDDF